MKQGAVVLLGPTGVGKTDVSIALARQFLGEIISLDSRLLYRGMDIGTAKPSPDQRKIVRHYLIDVAEPTAPWSLVDVITAARNAVQDIQRRGGLPFLVGGTGQYITAYLEGWIPPAGGEDARIRKRLEDFVETEGAEALHARLEQVDPARAEQIDPRNVRRVIRALEIFETTGIPPSQQRVKRPPTYPVLRIGLRRSRAELYQRIDQRIDEMFAKGWVEEVRSLLTDPAVEQSPAMSAIGYQQIADYLRAEITLEECVDQIRRLNRQFVRRQANWFKYDDPEILWFEAAEDPVPAISRQIEIWLGS